MAAVSVLKSVLLAALVPCTAAVIGTDYFKNFDTVQFLFFGVFFYTISTLVVAGFGTICIFLLCQINWVSQVSFALAGSASGTAIAALIWAAANGGIGLVAVYAGTGGVTAICLFWLSVLFNFNWRAVFSHGD